MEIKIEQDVIIPQGKENIILEAGDTVVVQVTEAKVEAMEEFFDAIWGEMTELEAMGSKGSLTLSKFGTGGADWTSLQASFKSPSTLNWGAGRPITNMKDFAETQFSVWSSDLDNILTFRGQDINWVNRNGRTVQFEVKLVQNKGTCIFNLEL